MKKLLYSLFVAAALALTLGAEVRLAEGGKTDYTIVCRKTDDKRLAAAVKDLARTLEKITGAKFPVKEAADGPKIVIAQVPSSDTKPLAGREVRAKSVGKDLYIYGEGVQGNSDAIYGFLESQLGCRWYTMFGDELIPNRSTLVLDNVDYSHIPSFGCAFFYGGDANGFKASNDFFRRQRMHNTHFAEFVRIGPEGHSLGRLIPPGLKDPGIGPNNIRAPYKYFEDKKYYVTNPEFFTMNAQGKRTIHQLCFSNPELRRELTKNIELVLEKEYKGGDACIPVDLNDNGGVSYKGGSAVCLCPECRKLIAKYQDGVGPYYDFMLEFAAYMKKKYPRVKFKLLAYWLSEFPPPGVKSFPDNIIVHMAPIHKNFLKPISHPSNAPALALIREWCKRSPNFQLQMYPTIYPQYYLGNWPLVANIRQLAENVRTAKRVGVRRLAGECGFYPILNAGFNDLRFYMLGQLAWDATRDENAIAREFFTAVYGKAAPLMIKYWEDLEKCEAEETNVLRVFPDQRDTLQYLTPANLDRWEAMFDEMEKLVADDPQLLTKVQIARMTLDEAVIAVYYKYPEEAKPDVDKIETRWKAALDAEMKRLKAPNWIVKYRGQAMELYLGLIRAKPLPEEFLKQNAGLKITRLLPSRLVNHKFSPTRRKHGWKNDDQAAFGFSFKRGTPLNDQPMKMTDLGVYRFDSIVLENGGSSLWVEPYNRKGITVKEIIAKGPGYHLYYVGRTMLWRDCRLTFGKFVPGVHAPAGVAFDPARPRAEFDVYVSLRYDAADGGTLFCDQVVVVELKTDCPKMQNFTR